MRLRATAGRLAQVIHPLAFGGLAAAAGMAVAFPVSGAALLVMIALTRRDVMALHSRGAT